MQKFDDVYAELIWYLRGFKPLVYCFKSMYEFLLFLWIFFLNMFSELVLAC